MAKRFFIIMALFLVSFITSSANAGVIQLGSGSHAGYSNSITDPPAEVDSEGNLISFGIVTVGPASGPCAFPKIAGGTSGVECICPASYNKVPDPSKYEVGIGEVCDGKYENIGCRSGLVERGGVCACPSENQYLENGQCVSCPSGYIYNGSTCEACPKGTIEENGICVPCNNGTYQDQEGQTSCDICPAGTYTPNDSTAYDKCIGCDANKCSSEGSSDCNIAPIFSCPIDSYATSLGYCGETTSLKILDTSTMFGAVCGTGTASTDSCYSGGVECLAEDGKFCDTTTEPNQCLICTYTLPDDYQSTPVSDCLDKAVSVTMIPSNEGCPPKQENAYNKTCSSMDCNAATAQELYNKLKSACTVVTITDSFIYKGSSNYGDPGVARGLVIPEGKTVRGKSKDINLTVTDGYNDTQAINMSNNSALTNITISLDLKFSWDIPPGIVIQNAENVTLKDLYIEGENRKAIVITNSSVHIENVHNPRYISSYSGVLNIVTPSDEYVIEELRLEDTYTKARGTLIARSVYVEGGEFFADKLFDLQSCGIDFSNGAYSVVGEINCKNGGLGISSEDTLVNIKVAMVGGARIYDAREVNIEALKIADVHTLSADKGLYIDGKDVVFNGDIDISLRRELVDGTCYGIGGMGIGLESRADSLVINGNINVDFSYESHYCDFLSEYGVYLRVGASNSEVDRTLKVNGGITTNGSVATGKCGGLMIYGKGHVSADYINAADGYCGETITTF